MTYQAGDTATTVLSVANELFMTIESIVGTKLGEGDRAALYDGMLLVRTMTPNNHNAALDDMHRCNQAMSGLNYLIYKLEEARRVKSTIYDKKYFTAHSRYSRSANNQAQAQSQTMTTLESEGSTRTLVDMDSEIQAIVNLIKFLQTEVYAIKDKLKTIEAIRFNTF